MENIEFKDFSMKIEKAIGYLKNGNIDLIFPYMEEDIKIKEMAIYALEKLNKENDSLKCQKCQEDFKNGYLGTKLKKDGFIKNDWISIKNEIPSCPGEYEITILKYCERFVEMAIWKNAKFQQFRPNCFETFGIQEPDGEILAWRKCIPFMD